MNDRLHTFHLEINSFEDFISFVAIIRGEDIDSNKIEELRKRLASSNTALNAAIEENK